MSAGYRAVAALWCTVLCMRRMDPMGTGRAKTILSSERKRTGLRAKTEAFVKPS